MKIKEMFKKITAGIGVFCATITSKVFAVATDSMPLLQGLYGPPRTSQTPNYKSIILNILRLWQILIVPIILILGIIILIKKHKNQKIKSLKIIFFITIITFLIASIIRVAIFLFNPVI